MDRPTNGITVLVKIVAVCGLHKYQQNSSPDSADVDIKMLTNEKVVQGKRN